MTPERQKQLKENIFEMWFELIRRSCEASCDPFLYGTPQQLESEYKVLENSKEVLKKNFIEFYHLEEEIVQRDERYQRMLKQT